MVLGINALVTHQAQMEHHCIPPCNQSLWTVPVV